jgi:membrane protease YdiL (CAAX protease family)
VFDPSIAPSAEPPPTAATLLDTGPAPLEIPRRIQPVERVGAVLEVLLCSGFPSQLLLIGILSGLGMPLRTPDGRLSPPFMFTMSMADAALVVGLVLFFLRAHRESARDVLLGQRRLVREVLVGIGLIPIVFMMVIALLVFIFTLAPQLHNVQRNPLEDLMRNGRDAVIFSVVVMVAGGVREEVQRGFILHRFEGYLGGGTLGVVMYSMLFGLGHLEQGIDAALATGLLGAIWGTVYLIRRSIVAPMVSHAGFNLAQLLKYAASAGITASAL